VNLSRGKALPKKRPGDPADCISATYRSDDGRDIDKKPVDRQLLLFFVLNNFFKKNPTQASGKSEPRRSIPIDLLGY
jgi:hypothetical protein